MMTAKATATGVLALIKFLALIALVALLVYAGKAIYDDQVEVRERIVSASTGQAIAERTVENLRIVTRMQEARAKAQAEELRQARLAVFALNADFIQFKRDQSVLLGQVRGISQDLERKPVLEVEADANKLMDEINARWEAVSQ